MSGCCLRLCCLTALWLLCPAVPAQAGDEDIKARIAAAGDADKYDADAVVVLDETEVTVAPSGVGSAKRRHVVKVLRDGGIRRQSVHRFDFDPMTNRMCIQAVRVYRADGSVEEVPLESAVLQPSPQGALYWGGQQFVVCVPRLEIGDAVETVSVKTGFNMAYLADESEGVVAGAETLEPPMYGHWHDEVSFWSRLPVIEKRYTVRLPKDKPLQYEVYNGELRTSAMFEGDQVVYTFVKDDIPPYKGEPKALSSRDTQCKLVLATVEDWEKKARWFYEKNEASFKLTDEIRAKVQEVTAGLATDEEKITALNHWVAENIRYVGTTRGAHEGYTTHPAAETLRDRAGVCKDKAGMLVALLRAAGHDSYIVITQAGTAVAPIPADQFNHAVTCIRKPDGSLRLLDPTWMPKSRNNWSTAEPLQHVLYGIPEGHNLSRSPYFPPEDNLAKWEAETAVHEDGALHGRLRFHATGRPESTLRRFLARRPPVERGDLLTQWFGPLSPNVVLSDIQTMDPVDFSGPFRVACDFAAEGYALGDAERRYLRLPMMQQVLGDATLYDTHGTTTLKERKYGVRLRASRRIYFEETIRLPEGWRAVDLPEAKTLDGPAACLRFEIGESAGQLRYTCVVDIKKQRIPPDEYGNYKEVLDTLKELGDMYIACKVETRSARR